MGSDTINLQGGMPMRWIGVAALCALPALCSCGEYPLIGKDGAVWDDPVSYRVDPGMYSKYRAIRDFQPPDLLPNPHNDPHLRMPRISTDYVWEVRHRVGDHLWIYSDEYARRGAGNLEIAISADGHVLPGWKGIANPKVVILRGDRAIRLTPDPRYDLSWGDQPLFKRE